MGEEAAKAIEAQQKADHQNQSWENMETCVEDICNSLRSIDASQENSDNSITSSSSSSDMVEDASSTSSSSSSSGLSEGPLYDLSELMAHLPLRRGLSKYYQGKSQSFTSLASAKTVEDLPKRLTPMKSKKKIKPSKSYGGGLDRGSSRVPYTPKPTISKRSSRVSSFLFSCNLVTSSSASISLLKK